MLKPNQKINLQNGARKKTPGSSRIRYHHYLKGIEGGKQNPPEGFGWQGSTAIPINELAAAEARGYHPYR